MPGLAIQNFLKQEIGDPDDQNAPKSDTNTDGKNTYPNLGSIKNKIYTSKWCSLVFQKTLSQFDFLVTAVSLARDGIKVVWRRDAQWHV